MLARRVFRRFELRPFTVILVVLAFGACSDSRDQDPIAPPLFSHGGLHSISGSVLGPDGSSICNFLPQGSLLRIRVVNPVSAPLIAATQGVFCPSNTFSINVAPGTYRLQALLLDTPTSGALPFRYLEPGNVVLDGGDVTQEVRILEGVPLLGSATLNGTPLPELALTLVYDFASQLGAAFGASGPDGAWDDVSPVARSPMVVQPGVSYSVFAQCVGLGTRTLAGPPSGVFLFPTEVGTINCTLATAPAVAFSHERTRLVVTAMPANIGGGEEDIFSQYGRGWGVQFPVDPSSEPVHVPVTASHLFNGGLVIGLDPNVILSGTNLGRYLLECGAACRDLGLDASAKVVTQGNGGNIIKWTYSDAPSGEGVGLQIQQQSFDGKPPADYVLFQYSITNRSRSTRTFYAGFFGDWDVDGTFLENIGFTELDGRLMYMTNPRGGIHVGSVLLGGAPVSGNFFFNDAVTPFSLFDQVRALKGQLRRAAIGPADNRVLHAQGPITLKRDKTAVLWIAIVAGESRAELLANAAVAAAHVGQMLSQATFGGSVSSTSLNFGEALIVRPSASLPWDGDEVVTFGGVPATWVLESSTDAIAVVVPRLPTGPMELLVYNQGPEQRTEALAVTVASTFTAIGPDRLAAAPDISGGPFPKSFFIELSNDAPDHFVTLAPTTDLPLTVTLEWRTTADLDVLWMNQDGSNFVGNFDGATLTNPERTSVTVPAGETYRLRFNKFDTTEPSSLARVTVTSP